MKNSIAYPLLQRLVLLPLLAYAFFILRVGRKYPHPSKKKTKKKSWEKGRDIHGQIMIPRGEWIGWLSPPSPLINQKNENKHVKIENKDNDTE